MIIPDKIKIGGHQYTVELVPEIEREILGRVTHSSAKILLKNAEGAFSILFSTFLHEVIHSINFLYGPINLNHDESINRLAEALYQIFVDNPEIFKGEGIVI